MDDGYIVTDAQKEACAIGAMRVMLEDYSQREGVPFAEALLRFADTVWYEKLFDFETRLWAEGPDYLGSLFTEAVS